MALLAVLAGCVRTEASTFTQIPEHLAKLPVAETPRDSSHAQYAARLLSSGAGSPQAQRWIEEARRAVYTPLGAPVPLREIIDFDSAQPLAVGFAVDLDAGRTLYVRVRGVDGPRPVPFLDLFAVPSGAGIERVASTQGEGFQVRVPRAGRHVLRVQPALGQGGRFEVILEQRTAARWGFPVQGKSVENIGSVFGDPRDGGRRKHEGVDIFAEHGTPVLAVAAGRVQQAGRNRLGGNIVWVGHDHSPYSTYYAHLHRVNVREGQRVEPGDRLGTVGNTGNARHAPPHLHFGIYQRDRALDPQRFLTRDETPPPVVANHAWLGTILQVKATSAHLRSGPSTDAAPLGRLQRGALIRPVAARESWFRFRMPDGRWGWMHASVLQPRSPDRVAHAP